MKRHLIFIICLLVLGLANCSPLCSLNNEVTQYFTLKEKGKKLRPIAKIVYKVSVERQEVVYWIEFPEKSRTQLYKLKNCIVADINNWEGEVEGFPPFPRRVEFIEGKFSNIREEYLNVNWYTWYFKTDPKPIILFHHFNAEQFIYFIIGILILLSIIVFFIFSKDQKTSRERIGRSEKDVFKEIKQFTKAQRDDYKKSGEIR